MLTFEEAKKIGINACIDKLGRDFVRENRDNGVSSYGEDEGLVYCYIGLDDKPFVSKYPGQLVLDSESKFPYYAECYVDPKDGTVTFLDFALPS